MFANASFIWCREVLDTPNAYVNFHETIHKKEGARYTLHITADSNYALYIGGICRESGQFADYPDVEKVYDTIDITPFLTAGENELLFIGYCQLSDSSTYRHGTPGILYEIEEDGNPVVWSSLRTVCGKNPAYTSGPVEYVSGQLGFSFHYDGTKALLETRGETVVTRDGFPRLSPRPIRKLLWQERCPMTHVVNGSFREGKPGGSVGERMQYAYLGFGARMYGENYENGITFHKEADTDGIYLVYDMGREESGYLTLDLELPTDAEILVGWGEHLRNMRIATYIDGRNFAGQVVAPAGRFRFLHPFRRAGGRYVAIQVYAPSVTVRYIGITPTNYPTTDDVSFHCADALHNAIYETCKRTLLLCMHEHYEDCPWREQALYTMDSRNQMLCGYYTFRELDFPRASLRLMGQSLLTRKDELLELCAPATVSITIPSFCAIYAVQLWEYLLFSGDRETAAELAPLAARVCRTLLSRTDKCGLLPIFPEWEYWNFYEWSSGLEGRIGGVDSEESITYDLPLNAFTVMAYDSLSNIYRTLGEQASAQFFHEAAEKLAHAAHAAFYDPANHRYFSKINRQTGEKSHLCQLSQALAVCSGICPPEALDGVLASLAYDKALIPATLSHQIFRYDALMLRPETYGRFVFDDVAHTYGYMLCHDATTFWETANGAMDFGHAGSLCHGWSAVPAYLYFRYVLGLYPDAPGHMGAPHPLPIPQTGIYEPASNY